MARDEPERAGSRRTVNGDKQLSDAEVRGFGFEPTPRGWVPLSDDVDRRMAEAVARRHEPRPPAPIVIEGRPQPCIVCEAPAEPSLVGTPTCSAVCLSQLADEVLPQISAALKSRADGSGGSPQARPHAKPKPLRFSPAGSGASVDRARERLASCAAVLERHGVRVRGRMAFCPAHENSRTPAMSLYERGERSRAHCHACGWDGDALDLEAACSRRELRDVIKEWGR